MTKTNQPRNKRKLIDLPADIIGILSDIAKDRRMSLKAYIESLVIEAATVDTNSEKKNLEKTNITSINSNH